MATTFNCLRCDRSMSVLDIRKSDGLCTACDGTDSMLPSPSQLKPLTEYLVVTDRDSKIVLSTTVYAEAVKLANLCRRTGGEVTVFKSTKA